MVINRARGLKNQVSNKWLRVPAKACSICRQTTHEADRDFREFVWLEWVQRRFTADGAELPSGKECYRCNTCRRRHFTAFKFKNLVGEMQKDPSLRDKFEEARKDGIQQTGQWSGIQITPESWTATTKRSIDEAFVEGLFVPMIRAATQRRLQYVPGDEADCRRACEAAGLTVVEDDRGVLGVEFADHDMGSYRFKRGLGTYNEVRSKSSHENNDEAEQQWAFNELKRESLAENDGRFLKPLAHTTKDDAIKPGVSNNIELVKSDVSTADSDPRPCPQATQQAFQEAQPFDEPAGPLVVRRRIPPRKGFLPAAGGRNGC